jgi:hypothetical protein
MPQQLDRDVTSDLIPTAAVAVSSAFRLDPHCPGAATELAVVVEYGGARLVPAAG